MKTNNCNQYSTKGFKNIYEVGIGYSMVKALSSMGTTYNYLLIKLHSFKKI